jgi:hypothetical protein
MLGLIVALPLYGCATSPKSPVACAKSNTWPEADATFAALQKFRPDPKGHHLIVFSRTRDAQGNDVKDMTVWPLSGPQEPAPGEKVRVVLKPCTYKLVKVEKLGG